MASLSSTLLPCNYAISAARGSNLNPKLPSMPYKLPVIRSARISHSKDANGRRAALLSLAATLFAVSSTSARAGIIDDYLEKSKANKDANDKKRFATSNANFARANTVEFGSCRFPENFTGCQDLAKKKKIPFLSEDLELECKGKDKFKCGSNVFWKW